MGVSAMYQGIENGLEAISAEQEATVNTMLNDNTINGISLDESAAAVEMDLTVQGWTTKATNLMQPATADKNIKQMVQQKTA
ncbi:MAG: hypothetical protein WC901_03035 [Candidatus Margulisiibacteriota bacterium]